MILLKSLVAISTTCELPFVLVTRKNLAVQSVQDIVALAQATARHIDVRLCRCRQR